MKSHEQTYQTCLRLLQKELVMAMGCTEPIAIAYAAAKAREALGALPERILVRASGSIIKNVKSVIVPHTGGRKGIGVAAAAGALYGQEDRELEALAYATEEQVAGLEDYLARTEIKTEYLDDGRAFSLEVLAFHGEDQAMVRIVDHHTSIVRIERNGEVLLDRECGPDREEDQPDPTSLTMEDIW